MNLSKARVSEQARKNQETGVGVEPNPPSLDLYLISPSLKLSLNLVFWWSDWIGEYYIGDFRNGDAMPTGGASRPGSRVATCCKCKERV
jgi:hypothetical protein